MNRGSIVDDRTENPIQLDLSAAGGEVGVIGEKLWKLKTWGSKTNSGGGKKYFPLTQALNTEQGDLTLKPSNDLRLGLVDFNVDMTGIGCNDVRFICAELERDKAASVDFTVVPQPDANGLRKCFLLDCEG